MPQKAQHTTVTDSIEAKGVIDSEGKKRFVVVQLQMLQPILGRFVESYNIKTVVVRSPSSTTGLLFQCCPSHSFKGNQVPEDVLPLVGLQLIPAPILVFPIESMEMPRDCLLVQGLRIGTSFYLPVVRGVLELGIAVFRGNGH